MPNNKNVEATGNSFIDALLNRKAWADATITFGFTKSTSDYSPIYGIGETANGYQALSAGQVFAAKAALSLWGELINLKLVETSGSNADIRIAASSAPKTAWAYAPGSSGEAGDVWFGTSAGYYTSPKAGNYGFHTFIHELGHSLGLTHPHENKLGSGNYSAEEVTEGGLCPCCAGHIHSNMSASNEVHFASGSTLSGTVAFGGDTRSNSQDAMAYSIMSYSSYANDGRGGYSNGTWDYAQTPMLRDVAAVQYLYGANYETRAGDTVYSWNPATGEKYINGIGTGAPGGNKVFETLWDGGGRDTIDLSTYKSDLKIDLAPGGWANFGNSQIANLGDGHKAPGNVAFAYLYQGDQRSLIENVVGGAGNDTIKGNAANNVLIGGAGNDYLEGISGTNILAGASIGGELSLLGMNKLDWISAELKPLDADGNDILVGGTGNDVFVASKGQDIVKGNGGVNTLVLDMALSQIEVSKIAGDLLFTFDGGSIKTTDIDYLAFRDGIFAISGTDAVFTPDPNAELKASIALVYSAGLNRDIDTPGLHYWSDVIDKGATLTYLASGIIASQEFATTFGNPSEMENSGFVEVLYQNVLDRAGEAAGVAYWTDAIAHGMSRADVLVAFSVSEENRANMEGQLPAATGVVNLDAVQLVAVTAQQWEAVGWA